MTSQGHTSEPTSGRKRRSGVVSMTMSDDPKRFLTVIHEDLEGERSRPNSPSVRSLARTGEKEEKDDDEEEEVKPRTTRSYSSCRLFSPTSLTLPGGRDLDLSPTRFDFGKYGGFGLGFELFPGLSETIRMKILKNGNEKSADDDDDDDNKDAVTIRPGGFKVTADSIDDKALLLSRGGGTRGGSEKAKDYMIMLRSQRVLMKPKAGVESPRLIQSGAQENNPSGARSPVPPFSATAKLWDGRGAMRGRGESSGDKQADENDEVLGKLKETATRLNLPTRRPSYLAWRERYLNPLSVLSASTRVSSGEQPNLSLENQTNKLDKLSSFDPSKGNRAPGIPILKLLLPTTPNGRSPPLARANASSRLGVSQRKPVRALRSTESNLPDSRNSESAEEMLTSSSSDIKQRTLLNSMQSASSEVPSDLCSCGNSTPMRCSVQHADEQKRYEPQTYTASVTLRLRRGDEQISSLEPHAFSGLDNQSNSSGSVSLFNPIQHCQHDSNPMRNSVRKSPSLAEIDRFNETTSTKSPNEDSTSGMHARDSAYNSDDEDAPPHQPSKDSPQENIDPLIATSPKNGVSCRTVGSSREETTETQPKMSQLCTGVGENVGQRILSGPHSPEVVSGSLKNDESATGSCKQGTCTKCGKLIQRGNTATGNGGGKSNFLESAELHPFKDKATYILGCKKDTLTPEKRQEIDGKLEWIKSELVSLRQMDQSLARQLLNIHHDLCRMRLVFSCQEHRELLEDMTLDLEEVETLKRYLEYPSGALSSNPLKHIGVTKMNLVSRRFSTC